MPTGRPQLAQEVRGAVAVRRADVLGRRARVAVGEMTSSSGVRDVRAAIETALSLIRRPTGPAAASCSRVGGVARADRPLAA